MKRVSLQNWPTYVVWQRPSRVDSHFQLGGMPEYIAHILQRVFQPPLFHQWVYQEIIQGLMSKAKMLDARFKGRIVPVDVCLLPQVHRLASGLYPSSDPEVGVDFTRDLGQWLTEQVMASQFARQRSGKLDFVVRCIPVDEGEKPPPEAWNPMRSWFRAVRWLEALYLGEGWLLEPPFWLLFPRRADRATAVQVEVQNVVENEQEIINLRFPIEEREIHLPQQQVNRRMYPLVGSQHAVLKAVSFPLDRLVMLYLRHCGPHETWIYRGISGGDADLGPWYMVPRDGWVPVGSGNIVLLGRIVKTDDGPRVVPGSLVFQLRYEP